MSRLRIATSYLLAQLSGWMIGILKSLLRPVNGPDAGPPLPPGITVVVPSRDGKLLLARLLPGVVEDLASTPSEIIVVDNGSSDGTTEFLKTEFPAVLFECSREALPFSVAVNCGIRRARYSHVCLLNNDMVIELGFFAHLRAAFDPVPELFCATAQIFFPEGERRQETGKAVMPARGLAPDETGFPVRCDPPLEGEDQSYVLYGSGGCSLYDTRKLRQLGSFGEMYAPAYVEDLDVGYRAWLRGWPTVFVAGARVLHLHRATTSRFFRDDELELVLDVNYLRFLARAVASPAAFRRLWRRNIERLRQIAGGPPARFPALAALEFAGRALRWVERPPRHSYPDELVLGLGSGAVAVFPGGRAADQPAITVSTALPRATDGDRVLVCFVDQLAMPPPDLLAACVEIITVRRSGNSAVDVAAFRGALQQTVRKWKAPSVEINDAAMARYATDCAPAEVILT